MNTYYFFIKKNNFKKQSINRKFFLYMLPIKDQTNIEKKKRVIFFILKVNKLTFHIYLLQSEVNLNKHILKNYFLTCQIYSR